MGPPLPLLSLQVGWAASPEWPRRRCRKTSLDPRVSLPLSSLTLLLRPLPNSAGLAFPSMQNAGGSSEIDSDVAGHDTRQIRIRQILKWTGAAAGMRAYAALEGRNLRNGLGRPPRLGRPISDRMANCDLGRPFNVRGCGEKYQGQRRHHFSSNAKGDAEN